MDEWMDGAPGSNSGLRISNRISTQAGLRTTGNNSQRQTADSFFSV